MYVCKHIDAELGAGDERLGQTGVVASGSAVWWTLLTSEKAASREEKLGGRGSGSRPVRAPARLPRGSPLPVGI